MKLSEAAKKLLLLIDSHTVTDSTGKLVRYWYPFYRKCGDYWCEHLGEHIFVSGSGDARCLKSLCDKGLTEEQSVKKYAYSITEKGRAIVDDILLGMGLQRKG